MEFKDDKIAQIMRANKRLSREASRIESVFQAIREGIMLCGRGGGVIYANAAARKILGVPEDAQALSLQKFCRR